MSQKRKRGRPMGTGIDDSKHLSAIADQILGEPDQTKTYIIRKIVQAEFSEHNHIAASRRLQRKWLEDSKVYMEAATIRRSKPRRTPLAVRIGARPVIYPSELPQIMERVNPLQDAVQQVQEMLEPPALRALREVMESSKQLSDMINPPALQQMREQMKHLNSVVNQCRLNVPSNFNFPNVSLQANSFPTRGRA